MNKLHRYRAPEVSIMVDSNGDFVEISEAARHELRRYGIKAGKIYCKSWMTAYGQSEEGLLRSFELHFGSKLNAEAKLEIARKMRWFHRIHTVFL